MQRLAATIPAARLAPYVHAQPTNPIGLYRWATGVSLAVFDDIGCVEVALRSAMARELAGAFGDAWFRRDELFDDSTRGMIAEAWRRGRLDLLDATSDVVAGTLVATLNFGIWVKLLGRGSFSTASGSRERRIYDSLLCKPALRSAFPGAGDLDRSMVESVARRVQALRNRIAHHEHIVWGVPLAGERAADGSFRRIPLVEAHRAVTALAAFIDPGLASWLDDYSRVPELLAACPADEEALLLA
ncbi:Abi family protein [Frondihabitans australicus]|uniref:Abi-like protein n=1 Tax=Frondihabitans australicus TaxID=386892 RepID=A0A495IGW4_9MICO|nr:Abi family protein [Frondihabitans australicus]RKR75204.1 Abi-like protein [Frondihabitans australicus]